ncbi:MAG: M23 family metallopeptidase [Bdellovibrionaceae bacterium]|nr:M23 family metallopeptidase [Pseudobdellovibrionaceae bacterium]
MISLPVRLLLLAVACVGVLPSCGHRSTAVSRSLPETADMSGPGVRRGTAADTSHDFLFDWPVDSARMTRGFLPHKRRPHMGLDLAAPKGTPILAARSGTVIYKGREFRGFGQMILIESGDGWATLYAHLDKIMVVQGQRITIGQIIGGMGRTGRATGVHLHFEIRRDRRPVDPLSYLPGGRRLARHVDDVDTESL